MSFGGLILTNSGRNLLAKAQIGKELKITRVGLGDGSLGGTSIMDLKALKHEVKSLEITKLRIAESDVEVTTFLTNKNMNEGFYLKEIGIFALDPDIGEILYCYDNAGTDADYIPAEGEIVLERNMRFSLLISNVSSVTAIIGDSLIFATKKDLENIDISGPIGIHNTSDKAHGDIRNAIVNLQSDMQNIDIPVTSVNSKTGAVALDAADVGAAPVSHTHTPSQVGLGNVQNYGIATTAEAQAGTVNNKYMTPSQVKAAVDYMAKNGGISMVKSVQRGYFKISGTSGQHSINISAVNPLKSLVELDGFLGMYNNGSDVGYSVLPSVTSFTNDKITLNSYGDLYFSDKAGVSWQVIEYY